MEALTEGVELVETEGAHAFVLGDAAGVEDVLALEEPDFLLVVKPGIEALLAETALALALGDALRQVVDLDVGVRPDVLLQQGLGVLQDRLKVAVGLHLVFKCAAELLVLHRVALLLQELNYHP